MTTNTSKPAMTADEKQTSFHALLERYAYFAGYTMLAEATTGTVSPDMYKKYTDALEDLATAIAYSVLNKCIDPQRKTGNKGQQTATSNNNMLISIRRDLARDKQALANMAHCSTHAMQLSYNDHGDLVSVTTDIDCKKALEDLTKQALGDGIDLVNDAVIAILDETLKQRDRVEFVNLERPYTVRRLKKKVWIKSADSVNGWETVETTPIREIYKAVRRAINSSRAIAADPRNGYSYIEDIATDPETGEQTDIYRRLQKCADIGGYACDFNGKETVYNADTESSDRCDRLIAQLNLTKKQAQVLALKQSGYGNKAIATYLGVTENSVKGATNEIRRKAKKAGYDPVMRALSDKLNNELASLYKAVDRLMDETPTARRTYAVINADIDKLNVRIDEINATLDEMEV